MTFTRSFGHNLTHTHRHLRYPREIERTFLNYTLIERKNENLPFSHQK